jgi:multidrug efflux pump subunit AcrA (membrane-fusion protein)
LKVYKESHDQLIRSAKAEVDKAKLDLQTAEVRSAIEAELLKLALEEAETRHKQLLKEDKLVQDSIRSQMRSSEIDGIQSRMHLQRAQANVDKMAMKTPIDGLVVMQSIWRSGDMGQVQEGDMVHPGQYFMQIVDPRSMVLNASVNQVDSEALRIGMKATIRLDAYPGISLQGHVYSIGAMPKTGGWRANWVKEIPIRLKLDEMNPQVIPDLSASADIVLEEEHNGTIAPLEAVFQDESATPYVFLKQGQGWVRKPVELGARNNVAVVVRSGLRKGDVIATQRPLMAVNLKQ